MSGTSAQPGSAAGRLREGTDVLAPMPPDTEMRATLGDVVTVLDTLDLLADLAASAYRAGKQIDPDALVQVLAAAMAAQPAGLTERQAQRRAQHEALTAELGPDVVAPEPRWLTAVHAQVDALHLQVAAEQTLTLQELIGGLECCDPDAPVRFAGTDLDGEVPDGSLDSWRGVYADLALGHRVPVAGADPVTAGRLLETLRAAVGATFTGYKGGDFTMSRETPVWVNNHGESAGPGIGGVKVDPDDVVVLHTVVRP